MSATMVVDKNWLWSARRACGYCYIYAGYGGAYTLALSVMRHAKPTFVMMVWLLGFFGGVAHGLRLLRQTDTI